MSTARERFEHPERRSTARISLLDADPDLVVHLSPQAADQARRAVTAPLAVLAEGPFEPGELLGTGQNAFGALIVSGLIAREVSIGGQPSMRLMGPGDLVHAVPLQTGLLDSDQVWSATLPTRLALLDDSLLQAVRHWPRLVTAIFERAADRDNATFVQLAASHHPKVEDRLALLFSALAERWGRMTAHGVAVPLSLTHEALARLVGARRPTVTLALKQLADEGRLTRRRDGTWLIDTEQTANIVHVEPLVGRSRPQLVLGPEADTVALPRDPLLPIADLVIRARALAMTQQRLHEHVKVLSEHTAQVRRHTSALLEAGRARRDSAATAAAARLDQSPEG